MFLRGKTADALVRQTVRSRRETTVNRAGDPMPNLFARAASLLLGEDPEDSGDRDVRLLLEALGYAAAAEFPAGGGEPGDFWPQFAPPAFCRSGGARHSVWPPVYAFGDHYAALGRYDCANRRGTTYTDGVALI